MNSMHITWSSKRYVGTTLNPQTRVRFQGLKVGPLILQGLWTQLGTNSIRPYWGPNLTVMVWGTTDPDSSRSRTLSTTSCISSSLTCLRFTDPSLGKIIHPLRPREEALLMSTVSSFRSTEDEELSRLLDLIKEGWPLKSLWSDPRSDFFLWLAIICLVLIILRLASLSAEASSADVDLRGPTRLWPSPWCSPDFLSTPIS